MTATNLVDFQLRVHKKNRSFTAIAEPNMCPNVPSKKICAQTLPEEAMRLATEQIRFIIFLHSSYESFK